MKIDSVIFDLDGTLWDSTENVSKSWFESLKKHYGAQSGPDAQAVASIMGLVERDIADRLFLAYGDMRYEVFHRCIMEEPAYIAVHGGELYEGLEEMLDKLSRRWPLFIVSNCQSGYIEAFLSYTGFGPYFKDHECSGNTGLPKAENIRLVRERNGLEAPVYVGDTHGDELSAHEAGCPFIFAAYGFGQAEAPLAVAACPGDVVRELVSREDGCCE